MIKKNKQATLALVESKYDQVFAKCRKETRRERTRQNKMIKIEPDFLTLEPNSKLPWSKLPSVIYLKFPVYVAMKEGNGESSMST